MLYDFQTDLKKNALVLLRSNVLSRSTKVSYVYFETKRNIYVKRAQSKSTANLAKSSTKRPTVLRGDVGANTTKNCS